MDIMFLITSYQKVFFRIQSTSNTSSSFLLPAQMNIVVAKIQFVVSSLVPNDVAAVKSHIEPLSAFAYPDLLRGVSFQSRALCFFCAVVLMCFTTDGYYL
jgi:hypothetical protein